MQRSSASRGLAMRPCQTRLLKRAASPFFCPSRVHRRHFAAESSTQNIGVLGAGITGLAAAYYITRNNPQAKVTLYEASDRVGGWLSSKRVDVHDGSILFEAGPRTLRPQGNGVLTARLMQDLDLAKDAIFTQRTSPAARNRYVYYPDHLVRMPHPHYGISDNLWSLLTEPVFKTVLWSGMRELWKEPRDASVQDESVGDFISRRFSKEVVNRLLSAVIHGIYAGDVWQLSAKSLFPTLWRDEGEHDSVVHGMIKSRSEGVQISRREMDFLEDMKNFAWDPLLKATLKDNSVFTFKEGLGMLSERLHARLFETGQVEFKTGTPVASVTPAEGNDGVDVTALGSKEPARHTHVISALSPEHLNQVCRAGSTSPPLIESIPTVTVMTVNLYFRTPDLHEPGFGYLIPQATPFENNPERALGVVFDTAYAPSPSHVEQIGNQVEIDGLQKARELGQMINVNNFAWYNMPERPNLQDHVKARGTKVTVMLGGHWWNGWPSFPDEQEGVAMACSVLKRHLGIKEEPEAWQVNLEKDCIPQYTVGHEQRLKQAHNTISREYKGRLRVAGNWMSGVGVNDCLRSAYEAAKNLSRNDATGLEHVGEATNLRLKPPAPGQKPNDKE